MGEVQTVSIVCPPLEHGSIVAWFQVNKVPNGFAPEKYRRQWLGKILPIREAFLESKPLVTTDAINGEPVVIAEPVRVHCMDAVRALSDPTPEEQAALEFWQDCFLQAILSFDRCEGNLYQQTTLLEKYPVKYGMKADLGY